MSNRAEYDEDAGSCYFRWLQGEADGDGEEGGDYAAEEEARINKALEGWNNRNIKKERGSTGKPVTNFRKMQPEEEGPVAAGPVPSTNERKVYKATFSSNLPHENGRKSLQVPELVPNHQTKAEYILSLVTPLVTRETLSLSLGPHVCYYCNMIDRDTLDLYLPPLVTGGSNKIKQNFDLVLAIAPLIFGHKTIEATTILTCLKRGICYFSIIHNFFPNINKAVIQRTIQNLKKKNIIEVKDKNNGYQEQAAIYEKTLMRKVHHLAPFGQQLIYYGLTEPALTVLPLFKKEIEKIVPDDIKATIRDKHLKDQLTHTEQEKRFKDQQELKSVTAKINELWLSVRYKYGKDADKVLLDRIAAKHGPSATKNMTPLQYQRSRLAIIEVMLKERR